MGCIHTAPAEQVDLQHGSSPQCVHGASTGLGALSSHAAKGLLLDKSPFTSAVHAGARQDPYRCFRRRQRCSPPRINEPVRMRVCMSTLCVTLMIILFFHQVKVVACLAFFSSCPPLALFCLPAFISSLAALICCASCASRCSACRAPPSRRRPDADQMVSRWRPYVEQMVTMPDGQQVANRWQTDGKQMAVHYVRHDMARWPPDGQHVLARCWPDGRQVVARWSPGGGHL